MYKIVGADGREYGPVTQEAILEWIAQGRANAQTIARFEEGAWKPLATFDEFKAALNISSSTPPPFATAPPPISGPFVSLPPGAVVARQTNQTAVWALACSIFGLLCCPCIGAVLGLILGFMSLSQIKENPHKYSTDSTLPKIAIAISILAFLVHCGYGLFGPGFGDIQREIEKVLNAR